MKKYIVQAELNGSITSTGVLARDDFGAKIVALQLASKNFVSDKRWDVGKITLKNSDGEIVMTIPSEIEEIKKKKGVEK
jgi:hypothetical protein